MSDNVTIPARRNWAHDPRMQTTTHVAATAGATLIQVTDRSFSGTNSVRFDMPANGIANGYLHATTAHAIYATITGTQVVRAAIYVSGPFTGARANIIITYTDGTTSTGSTIDFNVPNTQFMRVEPPSLAKLTGKTINSVRVQILNTNAAQQTLYWGGLDFSVNQAMDSFVSGAGGTRYSWEGTANNSPSNRTAYTIGPVVGSGGQIIPSIRVHIVNQRNQPLREITQHFIDGSINYDLDADQHKGSCTLVLDEPGLIYPLKNEYVRVTLRIEKADGSVEEGSLGLFNMDAPTERWSGGHDSWTYEGKDMLSLLATWVLPPAANPNQPGQLVGGFAVARGMSYDLALYRLLHEQAGFDPSQFSFAGIQGSSAYALVWEGDDTILTMLTDILQAAGWQRPWVTREGIITSAPAGIDPRNVTPSITMATGENSPIRWPFEVDPETSRVGNRVRVVSTKVVNEVVRYVDPPGRYEDKAERNRRRRKKN